MNLNERILNLLGVLNEGRVAVTIQDWGAVGEIIGGIAIIISLIYVGVQIKQNTKAIRVSTSHSFIEMHSQEVLAISLNPEFRDIFWRGLKGLANLQANEIPAFTAWTMNVFRTWEAFWYEWREGIFDANLHAGWHVQFCDLFGYAGIVEVWEIRQHQFSTAFREYTNQHTVGSDSKSLYARQEVGDA